MFFNFINLFIYIFLSFSIYRCTGWPTLQHSLTRTTKDSDKNSSSLLAILFTQINSANTGATSTSTPSVSSSKDITSFSIASPSTNGIISGTAISVTLTASYYLNSLVAKFTHTGVTVKIGNMVQTNKTTANDFTNSVSYIATAADGTTKTYSATVTSTNCIVAGYCIIFVSQPLNRTGGSFASLASGDPITGIDNFCETSAGQLGISGNKYKTIIMVGGTYVRNQSINWTNNGAFVSSGGDLNVVTNTPFSDGDGANCNASAGERVYCAQQ